MWATVSDVNNAYEGDISTEQTDWVQALIDRAERRLLSKVRSIPSRVESGKLEQADVVDVVVSAVLRVFRNPEGASMEMEGNYSIQLRADVAGGSLFFTADELAQVRGGSSVGYPGAIQSRVPGYRRRP